LKQVECVRAAGSKGVTCKVCLRVKQKCGAVWGEVAAGPSGFPALGERGMGLLERLVAGVEKMGSELEKANERLGGIERLLWERGAEEADELEDADLDLAWLGQWEEKEMDAEVVELERENAVFREFLRAREEPQETEETGAVEAEGSV
jgi:hypothetical protein